jgi:hypothetical protein
MLPECFRLGNSIVIIFLILGCWLNGISEKDLCFKINNGLN